MPSPTLRAIAESAGVSVFSVSRALRDLPGVAPDTRRRVRELAARMGYRPSPQLSRLMTQLRTRRGAAYRETIAWLDLWPRSGAWREVPSFVLLQAGARDRAEHLGYRLDVIWCGDPGRGGRRLDAVLCARGIRGLVLGPLPSTDLHASLDWSRYAAASFSYELRSPALHRVSGNHLYNTTLVLRRLHALGYRRPGLALEQLNDERVNHAHTAALLRHQQDLPPADRVPPLLVEGPVNSMNRTEFIRWYLATRPDVVIGVTRNLVAWLIAEGIQVPDDAGFANLSLLPPEQDSAGLVEHLDLMGASAVDVVAGQLAHDELGPPACPRHVLLEASWRDGPTLRPPPSRLRKT